MGSFIKQIRYVAVVVLCAVVFTLVTNCWNNDQARKWQVDSEDLIWGRIIQMQLGKKTLDFWEDMVQPRKMAISGIVSAREKYHRGNGIHILIKVGCRVPYLAL